MKNLKLFFGCLLCAMILLVSTGCKQNTEESKPAKYYVEGAVLDKTELQTIIGPYQNKTDYTFDEIKTVRNLLRACEYEDFFSEKDVSRDECSDFLTQHGSSPSEADSIMDSLDDVGNVIMFFNVTTSNAKAAYIYAEKQ